MTGQHLLLLLWTIWIAFALVSLADLLGVILALVYALLGVGLVLTGLMSWRLYVIAWLIGHVLVGGYAVAVLRGWLRPASGRPGLRPLWGWAGNSLLQTIFASVSFVGLASVLFLRPAVPWMYRADIPFMILVVLAVVAAEYALLRPARSKAKNRGRVNGPEFRLGHVEQLLKQQVRDTLAHSALESGPPVCFHASGGVSGEPAIGVISVELLRIAKLTMHQKGSIGTAGRVVILNGMADRIVGITIERKTVPISLEQDKKVRQLIAGATETPGWEIVSTRWVQAGSTGVNLAARTAADLDADLNRILHNEPVQPVFSWNAPGSAAAVIGKLAENKQILQIGGVVVGTRSGRPVAVSACFWSLARDDLTRSLELGMARALRTIGLSRTLTASSKPKQAARAPIRL